MIIDALLGVILFLINFAILQLPIATLPTDVSSNLSAFFVNVSQFNSIFPVDTVFSLLGYTVAFWVIVFGWEFFRWILHLIRGN